MAKYYVTCGDIMSRIGKIPVSIPEKVKVEIKDGKVFVEGPKGKLEFTLTKFVEVKVEDNNVIVSKPANDKFSRSMHGTTRAVINNMIKGVVEGYKKELEIVGVGYKAAMKGKQLVLNMGFSHPVEMDVPEGLTVTVPSQTRVVVEGIDKVIVGQFAANVRKVYPPEPYKGKGIRYSGEVVRRKLGKALAK